MEYAFWDAFFKLQHEVEVSHAEWKHHEAVLESIFERLDDMVHRLAVAEAEIIRLKPRLGG